MWFPPDLLQHFFGTYLLPPLSKIDKLFPYEVFVLQMVCRRFLSAILDSRSNAQQFLSNYKNLFVRNFEYNFVPPFTSNQEFFLEALANRPHGWKDPQVRLIIPSQVGSQVYEISFRFNMLEDCCKT